MVGVGGGGGGGGKTQGGGRGGQGADEVKTYTPPAHDRESCLFAPRPTLPLKAQSGIVLRPTRSQACPSIARDGTHTPDCRA